MRVTKLIAPKAFLIAALSLLAACVTPFRADVHRFQALPAPDGQSFFIQAHDPNRSGSLEFATYANMVRDRLYAAGYRPAASAGSATLVVDFDYGVSNGRERIATRPGFGPNVGFGFGYGRGFGGWGGRYGGYGRGWYGLGVWDPFYGPWGYDYPEVYSYTVYRSFVALKINRTRGGESVFEGRADATSRSDNLTMLVPNLVQALFTNFPGRSGETIHVDIDQNERQRR